MQEFSSSESIHSNAITITGTANGVLNSQSLPFQANTMSGNVTTATATISAIAPSTFIAEKNAFTQNPIVRLYSIYYPGEWYPPNEAGNPTGSGEGRAWPTNFPLQFAEIVGDLAQDIKYNVSYGGTSYIPFPVNITGLEQGTDGKINELSLSVFNVDNQISRLVEDPYLVGNNTSNSVMAIVNGEYVHGIDPRTVNASLSSFSVDSEQYISLNRARQQGLQYSQAIVDSVYGMANATFTREQTLAVGGTWQAQKMDTRDMLGGVVEIKTTFANFLDYWPEYSLINTSLANTISVTNALPYRVNDTVRLSSNSYNTANIISIDNNETLHLNKPITKFFKLPATEPTVQALTFKPDGTKFYYTGSTYNRVYEYDLPTPWDISSAQLVRSVLASDGTPTGVRFSDNGSFMFVVGAGTDRILRYTLSSAWNLAAVTLSETFNVAPYDINATGLSFDATGSNVYILGSTTDRVYQFSLATAYSLATAVYEQNVSISSRSTTPSDLVVSTAGDKFYVVDNANDSIHEYTMSTLNNVATATPTTSSFIGFFDTMPSGLAFDTTGTNMYLTGYATDNIHQIPLTTPWDISSINYSLTPGEPLYIVNAQADSESFIEDKYKIDQLEGLSEQVATFGLISWLQYFKVVTPRRKYYKNTCQWLYKGPECQYPGPSSIPGANTIPGTALTAPPYAIAANNQIMPSTVGDVCAKSLAACTLRNNSLHYGGFPGVGRSVPRV